MRREKKLYAMTAGMAAMSPIAVVVDEAGKPVSVSKWRKIS
jgi:hypothetical protein